LRGLALTRQVAPGASFSLSVPIDGTWAERFLGLNGSSSSDAALCTRELLETLAGQGIACRVLTTGILQPERQTVLNDVLDALDLPARRYQAEPGASRAAEVVDLSVR